MSREFIEKEVDTIFKDKKYPFPKSMAMACAWIAGNFKGINLKVLETKKTSSLADYFVLASATNLTQASAMADEIIVQMKRKGYRPLSTEGRNGADWILIDLGDVIVHLFLETAREVYDLENLWVEAIPVHIPNEYYHSPDEITEGGSGGYF